MKFIADLHVHSKYSIATAKNLDLENLYIAAQLKGITVVGTGDFTHPAWFDEISDKLVPAEAGLFKLHGKLARQCDLLVPESCRGPVRFMLVTEISNIYKKNGKTRKNHNLVFAPDVAVARQFSSRLDKIGNIKSDGRPILGLDARDLLEVLLETSEDAFLIPAHIWTPWFSVLGSKSGFESIEECFEDLTPHIFAVETGLSSDPAMNWRVSSLDGFTLVSNSDAHSPSNLGREANLFNTELSYTGIKAALENGTSDQFLGTFEFYPEEGKYHIDGHRACNISFWPETTIKHEGICPQCGKPMTLGVLYRVEELADYNEGRRPSKYHPYYSLIQLTDILSEILQVGSKSKKVLHVYQAALEKLGCEFDILHRLEPDVIAGAGIPLLDEAVRRMRKREINVTPGFDGQYGRVRIFKNDERATLMGQQSLFKVSLPQPAKPGSDSVEEPGKVSPKIKSDIQARDLKKEPLKPQPFSQKILFNRLNEDQKNAVKHTGRHLLIVAGPGTGKTLTLTLRIAHLITRKGVSPDRMLAVTFTRKAAEEMHQRLRTILGANARLPQVATFHAFCFKLLSELHPEKTESIIDEDEQIALIREAVERVKDHGILVDQKPNKLRERVVAAKQRILSPDEIAAAEKLTADERMLAEVYHCYQNLLSMQGLNDYADLIFKAVRLLENDQTVREKYRRLFQHIFVDEYQDLNHGQYRIVRALAPPNASDQNICVIGDPDQSIYGFRGSDVRYFTRFADDYPDAVEIQLTRNYRSTQTILDASYQVIRAHRLNTGETRTYSKMDGVETVSILELASGRAEARAIARTIGQLVGGTGFHSIDTGRVADANIVSARSYADFAVLVRTHHQLDDISKVFEQEGVPFQIASRKNCLESWGLAQLISLLSILEGSGSDMDLHNCLSLFSAGLTPKAADQFKTWCYSKKFSELHGLANARRFPVPGLNREQQQNLIDFAEQISSIGNRTAGMTISEKLRALSGIPQLAAVVNIDTRSRDAFASLLSLSKEYGEDMASFLATAALFSDTDAYLPRAEKVPLMTMHAAKGLEFPVVFIAGCEDDLIPYRRPGSGPSGPGELAEERRLFYVAMTRAREQLILTRAKKRSLYGKLMNRARSPFVADIENRLKKDQTPQLKKKKTDKQKQLKLF